MAYDWELGEPITKPCVHAEPQADSCLHGVCIFCWRDRAGVLVQTVAAKDVLLAALREEVARLRQERGETDLANNASWNNLRLRLREAEAAMVDDETECFDPRESDPPKYESCHDCDRCAAGAPDQCADKFAILSEPCGECAPCLARAYRAKYPEASDDAL